MFNKTNQHSINSIHLFQIDAFHSFQNRMQVYANSYQNPPTTQLPFRVYTLVKQINDQIARIGQNKTGQLITSRSPHSFKKGSSKHWPLDLLFKPNDFKKTDDRQFDLNVEEADSYIFNKKAFILGASGHLGGKAMTKALGKNYQVIATSRHPENQPNEKHVQWIKTPKTAKETAEKIISHMNKNMKMLIIINTVGGAPDDPNEDLYQLNVTQAEIFAKGVKKVEHLCHNKGIKIRYVYLSSIASIVQPDKGYGKMKKLSEKVTLDQELDNVTIFRVSYVLNHIQSSDNEKAHIKIIDNIHDYSMDQMAALPFHFIIGSGDQRVQFVFVSDLMDAIFNTPNLKGTNIINAVSQDAYTQETAMRYFVEDLYKKTFRPVYLPHEFIKPFSKEAPFGHLKEYATDILEMELKDLYIDPTTFKKSTGHDLKELKDHYRIEENDTLVVLKPDIKTHLKKIYEYGKHSSDVWKAIIRYTPGLFTQLCKAASFGESGCDFISNKEFKTSKKSSPQDKSN